jgi:hypothetical protein
MRERDHRNEETRHMENELKAKIQVKHRTGKKTFQMTKLKLRPWDVAAQSLLMPDSWNHSPSFLRDWVPDTQSPWCHGTHLQSKSSGQGTRCVGPTHPLYRVSQPLAQTGNLVLEQFMRGHSEPCCLGSGPSSQQRVGAGGVKEHRSKRTRMNTCKAFDGVQSHACQRAW